MKKVTKQIIEIIGCIMMIVCTLSACSGSTDTAQSSKPTAENIGIVHEKEFGGIYLKMTIEDFMALGFEYGDSVDISFTNGCTLEGVPYYNGYYTQIGEPLLVGYAGYPYIEVSSSSGGDLYVTSGVGENDLATITLAEKGRYLKTQEARSISYTDERSQYESDVVVANFREVTAGYISEGRLYRSASPCCNMHLRAPYVDALMGEAGVKTVIDLADTEELIEGYIEGSDFDSPAFLALYEQGSVVPVALNMMYKSDEFRKKIVGAFSAMSEMPGPYLVHCTEGKDRTGYVCMLIEALCGASYGEIADDYMVTYRNYYGITKESDPERYDIIVSQVLEPMIYSIAGDDADLSSADLAAAAEKFLTDAGMTAKQIRTLRDNLRV